MLAHSYQWEKVRILEAGARASAWGFTSFILQGQKQISACKIPQWVSEIKINWR